MQQERKRRRLCPKGEQDFRLARVLHDTQAKSQTTEDGQMKGWDHTGGTPCNPSPEKHQFKIKSCTSLRHSVQLILTAAL